MRIIVLITLLLQMPVAMANGIFGGNKSDDVFAVKTVEGSQAILNGTPKGLKAGDKLYFNSSPFQFTVASVEGNKIVITLPEKHNVQVGTALMRFPNDQVKKSIATEERLKKALED